MRAADPTNPARKRSSRTGVSDELRGYVDLGESVGAEAPTILRSVGVFTGRPQNQFGIF